MCKEGFSDGAHTKCLEDSIVPDSEESYLSYLAQKAAAATPDGMTLDLSPCSEEWKVSTVEGRVSCCFTEIDYRNQ
jgi:hypothetical protein